MEQLDFGGDSELSLTGDLRSGTASGRRVGDARAAKTAVWGAFIRIPRLSSGNAISRGRRSYRGRSIGLQERSVRRALLHSSLTVPTSVGKVSGSPTDFPAHEQNPNKCTLRAPPPLPTRVAADGRRGQPAAAVLEDQVLPFCCHAPSGVGSRIG
jgi:hypothetical protein